MVKRASVPEGKALFFRAPEAVEPVTDEEEAKSARPAPAEQDTAKSPSRQSAVFLQEHHLDWLEDRCREARRNGGRAIRKAAIIRALLDVAMQSPIDLRGLKREDELTERLRRGLRG